MDRVLVTGAGGFIGSHLCRYLKGRGHWVRGVDVKEPEWSESAADEFYQLDLRRYANAFMSVLGIEQVYALAADMGGAGYVFTGEHDWEIMKNNTLINTNTLTACEAHRVKRVLLTSSACVYPEFKQGALDAGPLKEEDAYPAGPDSEYGWEKLYAERMYQAFGKATNVPVRIARFHNIYGPECSWNDGREKVPAAACRKVAMAKLTRHFQVAVWGDGQQIRSFCYIDDCLDGLVTLMESNYTQPLNIGTAQAISINDLFSLVANIAGVSIQLDHVPGPQGVRSRNADLTMVEKALGWQPHCSLEDGLRSTYLWIEQQVKNDFRIV